ncbi:hypothetical protein CsSME_00048663 [Camellia sinensis var. sinensis]
MTWASHLFPFLRSAWNAIRVPQACVSWWYGVWFSYNVPKRAFILWLCCWKRLATKDRLQRWGMEVHLLCVLCNLSHESHDHLFFECPTLLDLGASVEEISGF